MVIMCNWLTGYGPKGLESLCCSFLLGSKYCNNHKMSRKFLANLLKLSLDIYSKYFPTVKADTPLGNNECILAHRHATTVGWLSYSYGSFFISMAKLEKRMLIIFCICHKLANVNIVHC